MQIKQKCTVGIVLFCLMMFLMLCCGMAQSHAVFAEEAVETATGVTTLDTDYGWVSADGTWRYYDTNGEAVVGVQEIDGQWYLFDYEGELKTGWRTVNGVRRYYDPATHEILTSWIAVNGYRYYADAENGKYTGEFTDENGITYLLREDGTQALGLCTLSDGSVSYYETDGTPITGFFQIKNSIYYFDENYHMVTGWYVIDNQTYYFSSSGAMRTGFQTIDGTTYYFNSSGVMQTGFQTISGSTYYFNSSGVMLTGCQTISGNLYYFYSTGVLLVNDEVEIDGTTYTADNNGVLTVYSGYTAIMGTARATVEQMQAYILSVNPDVAQSVLDMIPYYISEGEAEGIRGDIAFAMSCLETGNFTFSGSAVTLSQNNFCGLGVTYNGSKGCSFDTPQLGIRAQIQHLKAYASTDALNLDVVDPRFSYVTRGCAPYVEWLGQQENPNGYGWASGANYGSKILSILKAILSM